MKFSSLTAIAVISLALSGCATIMEGRHQEININVTPESADCVAYRGGKAIGYMNKVTHILMVSKSRNDMILTCSAPGYKTKSVAFESSASAWGIVGGLTLDLGIIDYSTGALNKYDGTLTMVLERQ